MNKCTYCGGANLTADIETGLTAETGAIGLRRRAKFLLIGVEPFYAELCQDCGGISRPYVKNTE